MNKYRLILSLLTAGLPTLTQAQEANDPFASNSAKKYKSNTDRTPIDISKVISLCHENFSISLSKAAAIQREGLSDKILYQRLIDGLKDGTTKQE